MSAIDSNPLVSVIVPVHNGEATVHDCLKSVYSSSYQRLEVIVVDDGSTDSTLELLKRFSCKTIQLAENQGAAHARNAGGDVATGDVLFFLDADVLLAPDTLEQVVRCLDERAEIDAVFCSYQAETVPSNFCSQYKNLVHHYTHQISCSEAITFCGGFGAVRRKVFQKLGGFDIEYRHLEDVEFGYRMHQSGHKILLEKTIQLTHCKKYSLMGLLKSDYLARGVPWTKIMLQKRIFRADLNTRINNVLSVPLAFGILVAAVLGRGHRLIEWLPLLVLAFLILNAKFFLFTLRKRGGIFLLRTVAITWITYLHSGIAVLAGVTGHFLGLERVRPQGALVAREP